MSGPELAYASLRQIERTGASELLERAFAGFAALPEGERVRRWYEVLGVDQHAPPDVIRAAYRELTLLHHPDRGGDPQRMAELNRA